MKITLNNNNIKNPDKDMGRIARHNVDSFLHPCKNGRRMKYIESKYGNDGYKIWYSVLEALGHAENHYIDLNEENVLMLIAGDCFVTEDRFMEIFSEIVRLGDFDKELFAHKIIFNQPFVDKLSRVYSTRANDIITRDGLIEMLKKEKGYKIKVSKKVQPEPVMDDEIDDQEDEPEVVKPPAAEKKVYKAQTKSTKEAEIEKYGKVDWRTIKYADYENDPSFDEEFKAMYPAEDFEAFVLFNEHIDKFHEGIRTGTDKQMTLKEFKNLLNKYGRDQKARDLIKKGLEKVDGAPLNNDININGRLKMMIEQVIKDEEKKKNNFSQDKAQPQVKVSSNKVESKLD